MGKRITCLTISPCFLLRIGMGLSEADITEAVVWVRSVTPLLPTLDLTA